MNIQGISALVTGGGSGLGEATARELAKLGAKVAVLDLNLENAQKVAADIGGIAIQCDVTHAASMENAVAEAAKAHGGARILMQIAGIGTAKRIVGKDGNPAPLEDFVKVVNVNLIGTYNARDLAQHGIRVCTIAPGIFATPLLKTLPEPVQASLAASIPFPSRLGKPEEFAQLAAHIVSNGHLNGEVIRLDGALRMAPR